MSTTYYMHPSGIFKAKRGEFCLKTEEDKYITLEFFDEQNETIGDFSFSKPLLENDDFDLEQRLLKGKAIFYSFGVKDNKVSIDFHHACTSEMKKLINIFLPNMTFYSEYGEIVTFKQILDRFPDKTLISREIKW